MAKWRLLLACAIIGLPFVAHGQGISTASSLNAPEASSLQVWVGHWKTTGESGGVLWHADTNCEWSPNHGFVVCDQMINGETNQLMILAWDSTSRSYRITSVGTERDPVLAHGLVNGHVWINTGEFDKDGKKIMVETTVDFSRPGHYTDEEKISEDKGVHWTTVSQGQSTKSK